MNIDRRLLLCPLLLGLVPLGCDSGPCHGSECAGSSMGSGHFTPGPLPHSAVELDGPRCGNAGAVLEIFQHRLFTDPEPPETVQKADALTVYWSVCNTGDSAAPAQDNAYELVADQIVSATETDELQRTQFSIPALDSCRCTVASVVFQNQLNPGRYHFSLDGRFGEAVDRVISP